MRFDFPEPFAPINTFSARNSMDGVSGPKDRIFRGWMEWSSPYFTAFPTKSHNFPA